MASKKRPPLGWKKALGGWKTQLTKAARVAIQKVLAVKKGERVLIVTNPEKNVMTISAALAEMAAEAGADATVIFQPKRTSLDMASVEVIHALRAEPDVILSISADKIGKDQFGLVKPYKFKGHKGSWSHIFQALLATKKSRSFWSPGVTLDSFIRTVPVDYALMSKRAKKLINLLDKALSVHITSPGGTDLEIEIDGRKGFCDDGSFTKPGMGGNLPAGEVYISPKNYSSQGVMVFDGSLSVADGGSAFIPKKPVTAYVEGGLVKEVKGGAGATRLLKSLRLGEEAARKMSGTKGWTAAKIKKYEKNARHLGELGIGLNPKAKVTGEMLEDEKILGTCHIAIGANYDDDAEAFIHLDCVVMSPTIVLKMARGREKTIMKKGKLL